MTTVTLDAADAAELAELLEYVLERLDLLAEDDLAGVLFASTTYGRADLKVDIARLILQLWSAQLSP